MLLVFVSLAIFTTLKTSGTTRVIVHKTTKTPFMMPNRNCCCTEGSNYVYAAKV